VKKNIFKVLILLILSEIMADKEIIEMLIEGGNAKPGPTTAPKLGMFKVDMKRLFDEINQETQDYKGMSVPIKVFVDKKNGSYTFKIGTPPVASLLAKELGLKKIAVKQTGDKEETETENGENSEEKPEEAKKEPGKKLTKKDKQAVKKVEKEEKKERVIVADAKMEQIVKVAKMKRPGMLSKTFKASVKEVVGSCVSMPLTIEGKNPKEILLDIDEGKYDDILKE
jgi:large subunit ribosomal protein L11